MLSFKSCRGVSRAPQGEFSIGSTNSQDTLMAFSRRKRQGSHISEAWGYEVARLDTFKLGP